MQTKKWVSTCSLPFVIGSLLLNLLIIGTSLIVRLQDGMWNLSYFGTPSHLSFVYDSFVQSTLDYHGFSAILWALGASVQISLGVLMTRNSKGGDVKWKWHQINGWLMIPISIVFNCGCFYSSLRRPAGEPDFVFTLHMITASAIFVELWLGFWTIFKKDIKAHTDHMLTAYFFSLEGAGLIRFWGAAFATLTEVGPSTWQQCLKYNECFKDSQYPYRRCDGIQNLAFLAVRVSSLTMCLWKARTAEVRVPNRIFLYWLILVALLVAFRPTLSWGASDNHLCDLY